MKKDVKEMVGIQSFALPALIGFFGGFLGPILVEKWKGREEISKKQIVMEEKLKKMQEEFHTFHTNAKEQMMSLENQLKLIELNLSRNTGVLKDRLPDAPLESPPVS